MMTEAKQQEYRDRAAAMLAAAGIVVTEAERVGMELADFGLDEFEATGLAIIVYENNDRYCAKELIMFPGMTCPEHRHPDVNGRSGKRETFRCRSGEVYLYVDGPVTPGCKTAPPAAPEGAYTVSREVVLRPGDQHTIAPDTRHWFKAGPQGAVVSEFSSTSCDEADIFTDARIQRVPD
jgi:D-lyxose ketol-isomerase